MLYHYTSFETFLRILDGITWVNDTPCLHLRASRIDKLNDPTELCTNMDTFMKVIKSYEKYKGYDSLVSNYLLKNKKQILGLLKVENLYYLPYVSCFSVEPDYLPMWSLYGDKHHGVCLCFEHFDKVECDIPHVQGLVAYKNQSDYKPLYTILDLNYDIINIRENLSINNSVELLNELSPFIKSEAYSYEHEYRHCFYPNLKCTSSHLMIANKNCFNYPLEASMKLKCLHCTEKVTSSYYDYLVPVSKLNRIILGNCLPYATTSELLNLYFEKKDYKIKLIPSKLPYF